VSIVEHPLDRQILSMWLADATFVEIGRTLDLTEEAVRKRFNRVQTTLKLRLRSTYQ
jgi:hypothetical protein